MTEHDSVSVQTTEASFTRRAGGPKELKVDSLADSVNLFLTQMQGILQKVPDEVGDDFRLAELTVSAEITAKGTLVLLGTGTEAGGAGGLTFRFERKPQRA